MNRRDAVLGLAALGSGLPHALAQQPDRIRRVGFLGERSCSMPANPDIYYDAFAQALRELGYVEGKNLLIEWRCADNSTDRLPGLARELAQAKAEVFVTHSTVAIEALQKASNTIPIVASSINSPDLYGRTMAHPTGNLTGLSNYGIELGPKRVELLKAMLPSLTRIAVFWDPKQARSAAGTAESFQATAEKLRMTILQVEASTVEEIDRGFVTAIKGGGGAIMLTNASLYLGQRQQIAALGLKHRMPTLSPYRESVMEGGLMSYGPNTVNSYRRAASYVDKILKGAKPADLPIEQSTVVHLAINRKTAKLIGLVVPQDLLVRADELID